MDGDEVNAALDAAFTRLDEIELLASAKNPDSELYRMNAGIGTGASPELQLLLEAGYYYTELTGGAFDITLGALIKAWGIGTEDARIPSLDEILEALNADTQFDLGAIAKGYAADEMKRVLLEHGVMNAVLDLGGDVITIGDKDGDGWLVGVTHPRNPEQIAATVRVSGQAVMTSGDYERYFMHNGVRYHHIFDSRTALPADSGIISATIISDTALIADVMSTAFFVMGVERAVEFANTMPDIGYILIDGDMNFYYSENIDIEIVK